MKLKQDVSCKVMSFFNVLDYEDLCSPGKNEGMECAVTCLLLYIKWREGSHWNSLRCTTNQQCLQFDMLLPIDLCTLNQIQNGSSHLKYFVLLCWKNHTPFPLCISSFKIQFVAELPQGLCCNWNENNVCGGGEWGQNSLMRRAERRPVSLLIWYVKPMVTSSCNSKKINLAAATFKRNFLLW